MIPAPDAPVVLITGGTRRLGRVAAETFAARGWDVVIHHRGSAGPGEELAALLHEQGRRAWTLAADLDDPAEVGTLIERALAKGGRLDALVNNASTFEPGRLTETEDDLLDRLLSVNLRAPVVLTRDFARVTSSGMVVNLLDSRIQGPDWTHFGYTLSKQALAEATRMAALELAPGIRVNGLAPGPLLPPPDGDEEYLARRVAETPLGRSRGGADLRVALEWLMDADFVTGQVIYVDGGQHLDPYKRGPGGGGER